ncbi:MAG: hypothetical protein LIV11_10410 [Bacillota bacterium]|nr:hypothetical protein [Bacillota bacterium]
MKKTPVLESLFSTVGLSTLIRKTLENNEKNRPYERAVHARHRYVITDDPKPLLFNRQRWPADACPEVFLENRKFYYHKTNAPKEKDVLAFMIFHDMLSPKGAGGPL